MEQFAQLIEKVIFAIPNVFKAFYYSKTLELRDNAYWDKKKLNNHNGLIILEQ